MAYQFPHCLTTQLPACPCWRWMVNCEIGDFKQTKSSSPPPHPAGGASLSLCCVLAPPRDSQSCSCHLSLPQAGKLRSPQEVPGPPGNQRLKAGKLGGGNNGGLRHWLCTCSPGSKAPTWQAGMPLTQSTDGVSILGFNITKSWNILS